jgi:hypothetical protein
MSLLHWLELLVGVFGTIPVWASSLEGKSFDFRTPLCDD